MEYKIIPGISWEGNCKTCGGSVVISSGGSFIHHCVSNQGMRFYTYYDITVQELCENLEPITVGANGEYILREKEVKLIDDDIF